MPTSVANSRKSQNTSPRLDTQRIRFHSIVVPTDLTPQSAPAIKLAARLAKQYQAKLHVIHATPPEIFGAAGVEIQPVLSEMNISNSRELLHQFAMKIPELRTVKHEEIVYIGSPELSIHHAVKAHRADLLVLPTHGRRGLRKIALGSVAEWAIRHLHCPVLVAGPHLNSIPKQTKSIVFAADLLLDSLRAAQYADSLAQEYNAQFTLIHVLPEIEQGGIQAALEMRAEALHGLRELLAPDARDWCTPKLEVETGDVAKAIIHTAGVKKADLIILGAQRKPPLADHLPWTTVAEVIREARCPVLVVPARSA